MVLGRGPQIGEGFMRELTRNAEQSGIMIMRSGVVGNNTHRPLDVEEFRGFSVSDHVAPLIFINGQGLQGSSNLHSSPRDGPHLGWARGFVESRLRPPARMGR